MIFWKNEPEVIAALEIGTHKVAVAVAELRQDGSLALLGVGESNAVGVRKGLIRDFNRAQEAVKAALLDAEQKTEVEIGQVFLSVSGTHLCSRNVMVRTSIEEEEGTVTPEHIQTLGEMAFQSPIPSDHELVHELLQFYHLDNRTRTTDPVGLSSRSLEAGYHLVHGLRTCLETQVRCVAELGVEVAGVALASYVSAQSVLTAEDKNNGAVLVDLGAGVTDYIVYVGGAIVHSGVIGLGGDHLTQDLTLGLKMPTRQGEEMKIRHGDLFLDPRARDEKITLPREDSFAERTVWLQSVTDILHVRQREILELIRNDLENKGLWGQIGSKIYFTGGASRMKGLGTMAAKIFPVPCSVVNEFRFEGDQTYNRRSDLSTVLGLLRYAQIVMRQSERPRGLARIGRSFRDLLSAMNLL
ncbi:MAG: cell division protein FtsA [Candidatus Methylacidiphilales bacterium]|nr:cell division protein FtsA [Candidatus Methylacidiphilales bacterium]